MLQRQNTQRKHRQSWSPKYKPTVTLHHVSMLMLFKETSNILMLSNHYDIQALFLISHPHPLHGKKLQHNLKHLHVQRNHISHSNIRISFIFCFIVWDSAGNITSAQPNTRKMKGIVGGGGGGVIQMVLLLKNQLRFLFQHRDCLIPPEPSVVMEGALRRLVLTLLPDTGVD